MALIKSCLASGGAINTYEMVHMDSSTERLITYLSERQLAGFTEIRVVKNSIATNVSCILKPLPDNDYDITAYSGQPVLTDGTWTSLSSIVDSTNKNLGIISGAITSSADMHWTIELR